MLCRPGGGRPADMVSPTGVFDCFIQQSAGYSYRCQQEGPPGGGHGTGKDDFAGRHRERKYASLWASS